MQFFWAKIMIDYWMREKNTATQRHHSKHVHSLFVDFTQTKAEHWPNAGEVSLLLPWNKELIILLFTPLRSCEKGLRNSDLNFLDLSCCSTKKLQGSFTFISISIYKASSVKRNEYWRTEGDAKRYLKIIHALTYIPRKIRKRITLKSPGCKILINHLHFHQYLLIHNPPHSSTH